jgi:hypothetical protein
MEMFSNRDLDPNPPFSRFPTYFSRKHDLERLPEGCYIAEPAGKVFRKALMVEMPRINAFSGLFAFCSTTGYRLPITIGR